MSSGDSSLPANVNEDLAPQDEEELDQRMQHREDQHAGGKVNSNWSQYRTTKLNIQSPEELRTSLADEVNVNNGDPEVFSLGGRSPRASKG